MAFGGGVFVTQNKVLPGSYINFVSASRASAALSERGVAAMAVELDWGPDGEVFEVSTADLQAESTKIFGYAYTDDRLKGIRDLFQNIRSAYLYRLNSGAKAANDLAEAKYSGTRGNDLAVSVAVNVDDEHLFDVKTLLGNAVVDTQTVKTAAELLDNDFVTWKKSAVLAAAAAVRLAGGSNQASVTGEDYQKFLDRIESCSFNTLGCLSTEKAVCELFVQYTKRMRDETGVKFQTVLYRTEADYEGVISVENKTMDEGWPESSAVYWVTGAEAGCAVGGKDATVMNRRYDGNFTIDVDYKQSRLEEGLRAGQFLFHRVGSETRVLRDINTFRSYTDGKSEDFNSNQTMRVVDQLGNDDAVLFNTKYLGKVPNDNAGRISLWNDLVKLRNDLQDIRAIEEFQSKDVEVVAGESKRAVVVQNRIKPVNAMEQLYMTTVLE